MARVYVGIDLGTTGTKVGAFDAHGRRVAFARATCPVSRPATNWAEQDPNDWWESVCVCWQEMRDTGFDPEDVAAIGLSGHFTVAFLDEYGRAARPAITWQDARAVEEAQFLADRYDEERIRRLFGVYVPFSPAMPAAKIRWVMTREPEQTTRIRWVCQAKDTIALQLCGEVCGDVQSFIGIVNSVTGEYDEAYLADLGLRPSHLPRFTPAYRNAGYATKEAQDALGVPIGVPIITGWVDAFCSMLASGVYRDRAAFDYAGTSEIVGMRVREIPERYEGLIALPFDRKSAVLYGLTNCGADALVWAQETLGLGSVEALLDLAARVTPSDDLPLFLPYLDGERSPVWDPEARGVWLNLRRDHTRAHLAYSVLEGVAHAVAEIQGLAAQFSGEPVEELVVSGGGARSDLWSQIRADVAGLPVQVVAETETGALGAAILAAVGFGEHESMADGAEAMTRFGKRFEPRPEPRAIAERRHAIYARTYSATRELR